MTSSSPSGCAFGSPRPDPDLPVEQQHRWLLLCRWVPGVDPLRNDRGENTGRLGVTESGSPCDGEGHLGCGRYVHSFCSWRSLGARNAVRASTSASAMRIRQAVQAASLVMACAALNAAMEASPPCLA